MSCQCPMAVVPVFEDWISVAIDPSIPPISCKTNGIEVAHDDLCVVEIPDGRFLGRVTLFTPPVVRRPCGLTGRILRLASEEDAYRQEQQVVAEQEIEAYMRRRVGELALDVKPIKVRIPMSGNKAVVYFTTEQRIDFRPLVKELGRVFRRRIETRPLGVRDGARQTGGLGPCGRSLCCATFMTRFNSVTVRMAKRQNLSLNPTKISGLCGRLMCCLAHEVDQYPEASKRPKKPPDDVPST